VPAGAALSAFRSFEPAPLNSLNYHLSMHRSVPGLFTDRAGSGTPVPAGAALSAFRSFEPALLNALHHHLSMHRSVPGLFTDRARSGTADEGGSLTKRIAFVRTESV
jgi:hypothetical protein